MHIFHPAALLALMALAAAAPALADAPAAQPKTALATPKATLEETGEVRKITYPEIIDIIGESRGKVVLINFWASWCAPCREEIPELKRLRREVGENNLVMLGISLDSSLPMVQRLAKRFDMNYPVYLGGQDIINAYSLMAIPRTVIYNPQGERVFSHEGYMNRSMLQRAVTSFLAKAE